MSSDIWFDDNTWNDINNYNNNNNGSKWTTILVNGKEYQILTEEYNKAMKEKRDRVVMIEGEPNFVDEKRFKYIQYLNNLSNSRRNRRKNSKKY